MSKIVDQLLLKDCCKNNMHSATTTYWTTCLLFIISCILLPCEVFGQGLVVNEISNGRFNNYEYIELIVAVECPNDTGTGLDIRDWRVDDNNGDFACDPVNDVGIATGHIRFNMDPVWVQYSLRFYYPALQQCQQER